MASMTVRGSVLAILAVVIAQVVWAGGVETQEGADEVTLESVPPVVVKTVPEAGAAGIDPATKSIKVTFSKPMMDQSWSWSTASKETFPTLEGKPKYEADGKTCVVDVKLEAGKTYAVWLNSGKFRNFKDKEGRPAVPYLLVFKTGDAPAN